MSAPLSSGAGIVAVQTGLLEGLDMPRFANLFASSAVVPRCRRVGASVAERVQLPALPIVDEVKQRTLPVQDAFFFLFVAT